MKEEKNRKVSALVMAGGKAERLGLEKPLVKLGDKFLIDYVLETLEKSKQIDEIFILTSKYTMNTHHYLKSRYRMILSSGEDFVEDYRRAAKTLNLEVIVIMACDLPFLKPETVDKAVKLFFKSKKETLMVVVKAEDLISLGLKPDFSMEFLQGKLCPIGLNVINCKRIDEPLLEQEIMILKNPLEAFNIDNKEDLKRARKILKMELWTMGS
ncbi:MAG: NTP transferase domain-containing protein [Nitrososphaerales archaeon]